MLKAFISHVLNLASDASAAQQDVPLMEQAQSHSLSEEEQTGELINQLYMKYPWGSIDKLNYWYMHVPLRVHAGKIL